MEHRIIPCAVGDDEYISGNLLGNDGWEMVSCTSTNQSYGASKSIVCIFKRKKDQYGNVS